MKLKNNDPGKIWAKSDKRFKSYDQKVHFWAKKGIFGTVQEPDQLPGSRVPGFLKLPGSGYPVPDKPTQNSREVDCHETILLKSFSSAHWTA